jgi:Family of unknown function (DUF5989)/Saxitoxin biosynthesis operon protein SxtJ
MFHENLRENIDSKTSSPRSFGLTFAALFLVIGAAPLLRHGHVRAWSLVLGLIILTIALTQPRVLGPLNRAWSLIGSLLSRVTTPVLMAILFVLVITPIALLRRTTGSSGLALRFDPKLESYWIRRDQETVLAGSMSILLELWQFLRARKRYWLYPIIIIMVLVAVLTIVSQGSALAPFIYALF